MKRSDQAPIHVWAPGIRDDTGGIQAFSRFFVRALHDEFPEHPVRVFVKNESPKPEDAILATGDIEIQSLERVPPAGRTLAMAGAGILRGLGERPICALSTHLHFLPALHLMRSFSSIPYGGVLHGIEAWKLASAHRRHAMRAADRLFAVSHFTRDRVIEDHAVDPARIGVVPNTFDGERFSPGPKPAHLLERYGLRPDQPVLLTVSRLALSERYKGHWQVLLAMKRICATRPDAHYLIAGTGDEIAHLRAAVKTLGLERNVTFAGFVPSDELPDHYRLCDVFVMPSTKEGFGIVFLEAAASGKPVIAGDQDGSVDALDHGRLGILTDPHDPAVIADAVMSALNRTHENRLLFEPERLSAAVKECFGFARMKEMLKAEVSILLDTAKGRAPGALQLAREPSSALLRKARAPRVVVLTQLNSPYQVEFFNRVAASGGCHIEVIYLTDKDRNRQWVAPDIAHSHVILTETPSLRKNALDSIASADLVIFNYYTDIFAWRAIRSRARSGKPWVFWGERPGFFHLGAPGRWFRRVFLAPLHERKVPIWGVGGFGIEGYQAEFGLDRAYANVPYYSNLERFDCPARNRSDTRTVLYSGSFIQRKGADLLARAFVRAWKEHPCLRLALMGAGELEESMRKTLEPCGGAVEWIGFQPWDELPSRYARADFFCLPSRYDGWGLALVEALASGLPAIGTDSTGAAVELVKEGENGWLIPAGDEGALVEALGRAATLPPADLARMEARAREAAKLQSLDSGARNFMKSVRDAIVAGQAKIERI